MEIHNVMTEAYSKSDADKLVAFYSPLLIGEYIVSSTNAAIKTITIEDMGSGKFHVYAEASFNGATIIRSIEKVAADHSLMNPNNLLGNQGQN
jgi:hypothetical protein